MTDPREQRLCIDCKWAKKSWYDIWGNATCVHVKAAPISTSLVTGTKTQERTFCSSQRLNYGECKPEGLLWEPRK